MQVADGDKVGTARYRYARAGVPRYVQGMVVFRAGVLRSCVGACSMLRCVRLAAHTQAAKTRCGDNGLRANSVSCVVPVRMLDPPSGNAV